MCFEERKFITVISKSCDRLVTKNCQFLKDTLDYAELQSIEKTNIKKMSDGKAICPVYNDIHCFLNLLQISNCICEHICATFLLRTTLAHYIK